MTKQLTPIKIYGGSFGPNPFKVSVILGELGLPVEEIPINFTDLKTPAYEVINPNGCLPTIHDPNTGLTLWESGAIIEYLIETYDKDQRISFAPGSHESYHARQMLHFQMSGQGPYYGQAVWFKRYHPERVQSALDRYLKEIKRVCGVLDGMLAKQQWLVGDKLSYADLAFVSWQNGAKFLLSDEGYHEDEFPNVAAWIKKMNSRPVVHDLLVKQDSMMAEKLNANTAALKKESDGLNLERFAPNTQ